MHFLNFGGERARAPDPRSKGVKEWKQSILGCHHHVDRFIKGDEVEREVNSFLYLPIASLYFIIAETHRSSERPETENDATYRKPSFFDCSLF